MSNELFTIGPVTIYGYGFMITIRILAAYLNTVYLAKKIGQSQELVFNLWIIGVGSGIIGAKLMYYITVLDEIIANPRTLLKLTDGFVVYGGIITGILGAWAYSHYKKLSF